MKKALAVSLLLLLSAFTGLSAKAPDAPKSQGEVSALTAHVYQSVVLLYTEDESGGMKMLCTATAYRKTDKGYRFVSASHCVQGDTESEEHEIKFFITADDKNAKNFIRATLIEAGDRKVGDDFSIFEIQTKDSFVVTPLGYDTKVQMGEVVIDIASPLGLGKQFFIGYVSSPHVDRPPIDAGVVKWSDIMLVMIGAGPGSSGSAIVSVDQKAIIGFLVGGTGNNIGAIVVPVNRFRSFEEKVDAGKYKKTPIAEKLKTEL